MSFNESVRSWTLLLLLLLPIWNDNWRENWLTNLFRLHIAAGLSGRYHRSLLCFLSLSWAAAAAVDVRLLYSSLHQLVKKKKKKKWAGFSLHKQIFFSFTQRHETEGWQHVGDESVRRDWPTWRTQCFKPSSFSPSSSSLRKEKKEQRHSQLASAHFY
jgi:hypothetical protein